MILHEVIGGGFRMRQNPSIRGLIGETILPLYYLLTISIIWMWRWGVINTLDSLHPFVHVCSWGHGQSDRHLHSNCHPKIQLLNIDLCSIDIPNQTNSPISWFWLHSFNIPSNHAFHLSLHFTSSLNFVDVIKAAAGILQCCIKKLVTDDSNGKYSMCKILETFVSTRMTLQRRPINGKACNTKGF